MSFLQKLFGGRATTPSPSTGNTQPNDPTGLYLFARCAHCGTVVRVRADRQNDLNHDGGGYVWHKTIVDSKCFRRMTAVVSFDRDFNVTTSDLQGGEFVSAADYDQYNEQIALSKAQTVGDE